MKTRPWPRTDLAPSLLCLGTAEMGGGGIDDETSEKILDRYLLAGGTFIDTARVYSDWVPGERHRSEKFLGRWLRDRRVRDAIILSTKGGHPPLDDMQSGRLSSKEIGRDLDESLRTLGVDFVDVYWLHRDERSRPVEEIILTLDAARQAGKIRYAGYSNWALDRAEAALAAAESLGVPGFVAGQNLWSLAVPDLTNADPTWAAVDVPFQQWHARHGFAAIPYSTQANGYFRRLAQGTVDRASELVRSLYDSPTNRARYDRLQALATETGQTSQNLALGYLFAQEFPVYALIGPRSVADLEASLPAADILLTPAQRDGLEVAG